VNAGRQRGERGLEEALARLTASQGGSVDERLIPFAETLMWVYALREWHRIRLGRSEAAIRQLLRGTDGGRTVAAICWARTPVQHDNADITMLVTPFKIGRSTVGRSAIEGAFDTKRWVHRADLPLDAMPLDERANWYGDQVGGQTLERPLEAARAYLVTLP
jgi:hypothetical protein